MMKYVSSVRASAAAAGESSTSSVQLFARGVVDGDVNERASLSQRDAVVIAASSSTTTPPNHHHHQHQHQPQTQHQHHLRSTTTPLWAWAALALSVAAMSTGGLWFALQDDETPPLLKAAWRLGLTALLQIPGFAWAARPNGPLPDNFWVRIKMEWLPFLGIGIALGSHFGLWGWSVAHTSMTHSLVLVWSTPIVLVVIIALRAACRCGAAKPPTLGEVAGAFLGFAGVAVMLSASRTGGSTGSGPPPTLLGDVAAFAGGAVIIIYLEGGARLRQWVPTFIFALPVTCVAASMLAVWSIGLEGATVGGFGPKSLLGFAGSPRRAGLALAAASVSGILGHTAANAAVKHIPLLALTVAALWEPILGSLLGYAVGLEGPPGALTLLSAIMILAAGLLVSLSGRDAPPLPIWCFSCFPNILSRPTTPSATMTMSANRDDSASVQFEAEVEAESAEDVDAEVKT